MSTSQTMKTTQGNNVIVWILLGIAVVVNIAGFIFNLYSQFAWFDEVVHGYTIFALTLPLGLLAYGTVLTGYPKHKLLLILVIASMGLAIGALWEVAEFLYDWLTGPQSVIKNVPDRLVDLMMDTIGAVVAGIVVLKMQRW